MTGVRLRAVTAALLVAGAVVVTPSPASADHPAGAVAPYDWACPEGEAPEDGFVDVPPTNVHETAVDCAVWRGLVAGTGPGTYTPDGIVTRGQMATFVARLGELGGDAPNAFDDDDGTFHERAINQLAAAGLAAGTGPRTYSPSAPVTRGQLATYLVKVFERRRQVDLPAGRDRFDDDRHSVHQGSVNRAASMRILSGVAERRYAPDAPVRRDQMARFLTATRGCTHAWQRDGTWHDTRCDAYTDTEGPQALQGFDVVVTTAETHHVLGQPVAVTVQTCNRRDEPLEQVFPQREWFTLEARHEALPFDYRWTQREWYDHRFQPTLNGFGYGERDMSAVHFRVGARHPRTVALTWYDGPQTGPEEVVVWQPGECKSLDVGAWQQGNKWWWEVDPDDFPAQWRQRAEAPQARTTPGWHTVHLSWGGVEVGQTRRYFAVDSERFLLDGPRITAAFDEPRSYARDETVPITVRACNEGHRPYREFLGDRDVTGEVTMLELSISGNYDNAGESLGSISTADRDVEWAAGECKSWAFTWDQTIRDRYRAPNELFVLAVAWNPGSADRVQYAGNPHTGLE